MVGLGRVELPTSRLSSARSNQLSYKPNKLPLPSHATRKKEKRRRRHPAKRNLTWFLIFPVTNR
jgi:hypothetical protein